MLRTLRERMAGEGGFSLLELLVVILIMGILAAVALPAFLGQRHKAQDANAKSDARNFVSAMQSCFTWSETYVGCDTSQDVTDLGIATGTSPGQVTLSDLAADAYRVVGHSESGNDFTIQKAGGASPTRTCTTQGKGTCPSNGNW
jgi:type IV pilus assembly protein PilA